MTTDTEQPEYVLKAGAYFLSRNLKTWSVGISNAGRMTREQAEAIRETFISHTDVDLHHESEFLPKKEERPAYVIRHGGYFYRRNAQGYCSNIIEAGRWTKAEAEKHRNDDPLHTVTIHHESEFAVEQGEAIPLLQPRTVPDASPLAAWIIGPMVVEDRGEGFAFRLAGAPECPTLFDINRDEAKALLRFLERRI
ncbi:hypothetical protein [Microvirga sp. Mcv34]|uniref:hypothetical protein n=1 Tax=Microvirga sp. Mcv34 TaxID=2926016 RepID=UPI0021C823E6|nr:hypothetical protein [Microvirga sp. Mcv34]